MKKPVLLFLLAFLTLFLFVGGLGDGELRSLQALWDLGHIPLFFLVMYVLFENGYFPQFTQASTPIILAVKITLATLLLGVAIEIVQLAVGRSAQINDLINDFVGAFGYFAWSLNSRFKEQLNAPVRYAAVVTCVLLLGVQSKTLLTVSLDEWNTRETFPQLLDFESTNELSRWSLKDASAQLSDSHVTSGSSSVRVTLEQGSYPGWTLDFFPRDWRGYRAFALDLYWPQDESLRLYCHVYDSVHRALGKPYEDRYELEFDLKQGWNFIQMDLAKVEAGPESRTMDMADIQAASCFAIKLAAPTHYYLDNIRLIR